VTKLSITNFDGVYEPAEDSYLFVNHIPKLKGSILEIGCGTGIIGISLALKGNKVTAVDINPLAVEAARSNAKRNSVELEVLESDMFSSVEGRIFDTIVCNPPYLPSLEDEYNDSNLALAVEGGPTGSEFTIRLLEEARNYLKPQGSVYTIVSSKMKNFQVSWKQEVMHEQKFFFERLRLVRFWCS
tara:strand:- start:40 stop:597 length:558 start_codon:yes stop_codon:yes gene_type:complete